MDGGSTTRTRARPPPCMHVLTLKRRPTCLGSQSWFLFRAQPRPNGPGGLGRFGTRAGDTGFPTPRTVRLGANGSTNEMTTNNGPQVQAVRAGSRAPAPTRLPAKTLPQKTEHKQSTCRGPTIHSPVSHHSQSTLPTYPPPHPPRHRIAHNKRALPRLPC